MTLRYATISEVGPRLALRSISVPVVDKDSGLMKSLMEIREEVHKTFSQGSELNELFVADFQNHIIQAFLKAEVIGNKWAQGELMALLEKKDKDKRSKYDKLFGLFISNLDRGATLDVLKERLGKIDASLPLEDDKRRVLTREELESFVVRAAAAAPAQDEPQESEDSANNRPIFKDLLSRVEALAVELTGLIDKDLKAIYAFSQRLSDIEAGQLASSMPTSSRLSLFAPDGVSDVRQREEQVGKPQAEVKAAQSYKDGLTIRVLVTLGVLAEFLPFVPKLSLYATTVRDRLAADRQRIEANNVVGKLYYGPRERGVANRHDSAPTDKISVGKFVNEAVKKGALWANFLNLNSERVVPILSGGCVPYSLFAGSKKEDADAADKQFSDLQVSRVISAANVRAAEAQVGQDAGANG